MTNTELSKAADEYAASKLPKGNYGPNAPRHMYPFYDMEVDRTRAVIADAFKAGAQFCYGFTAEEFKIIVENFEYLLRTSSENAFLALELEPLMEKIRSMNP